MFSNIDSQRRNEYIKNIATELIVIISYDYRLSHHSVI